ncbi:MAG: translation initiation factor IF-3 [Christensenellales bacterium]|jgi:translation initiation factor IF-3
MRYPHFYKEGIFIKDFQVNEQIRDREVKVIDTDGNMLGVMTAYEAQRIADQRELDLVKISPNANPPVCKILDYGKFKFEFTKKEKEAKKNQKIVELKEIRLSVGIDVGDINTKAKNTIKFLENGDRVKVTVRMRGRQQAHPEIAVEVLNDFYSQIKDWAVIDKKPSQEGRVVSMFLSPNAKTK